MSTLEVETVLLRHPSVGDVVLTFLSRYPKFANMYKERDFGEPTPAAMAGDEIEA